jgi:hypothetical protein
MILVSQKKPALLGHNTGFIEMFKASFYQWAILIEVPRPL